MKGSGEFKCLLFLIQVLWQLACPSEVMKERILHFVPKAFMDNFLLTFFTKERSSMQIGISSSGSTLGIKAPVAFVTQDHSGLVAMDTTKQAWPRVNFPIFRAMIKVYSPTLN